MKRSPSQLALRLSLLSMAAFALGSLVFSSSSCTAIGYAIGDAAANREPPRMVPAGSSWTARAGTPMALSLEDSTRVSGFYLGRANRDEADYVIAFAAWQAATPDAPALGGTIALLLRDGRESHAVFRGFAYRSVRVTSDPAAPAHDVRFATLRGIRVSPGRTWTGDELAALDAAGRLPSREALLVGVGRPFGFHEEWNPGPGITQGYRADFPETARVALDRVASVTLPAKGTSARVMGTIVGLAADVLVVRWINTVRLEPTGCYGPPPRFFGYVPPATKRPFDTWAGEFVDASPTLARGAPAPIDGPPGGMIGASASAARPEAEAIGSSVAVPAAQ